MKIATIIVRILLGGMMLFASIAYFFDLAGEQPSPTGDMATNRWFYGYEVHVSFSKIY